MKRSSKERGTLGVAEMAAAVGLSRDRFHDLLKLQVFPPPVYLLRSHRPVYPPELQQSCLVVRFSGIGFNGAPIAFNRTKRAKEATMSISATTTGAGDRPDPFAASLVPRLRRLGIQNVDAAAVERALAVLFPAGTAGMELGETLRQVVVHLSNQCESH